MCVPNTEILKGMLRPTGLVGVKALDVNLMVPSPENAWFRAELKGSKNWTSRPALWMFKNAVPDVEDLTLRIGGTCYKKPNAYDLVSR